MRDKLLIIEGYCRTRDKTKEILQQASELRLLAEKKLGNCLKAIEKKQGERTELGPDLGPSSTPLQEARNEAGISKQDAARFQKLADIPDAAIREEAEAAAEERRVASARRLVEAPTDPVEPKKQRVRQDVMQTIRFVITNFERSEVDRIVAELQKWLKAQEKRQG